MRGKIKLVSVVLCALVMFGFALTANAQINWNVSTNPNEVTQYGVTELMGVSGCPCLPMALLWAAQSQLLIRV